MDQPFDYRNTPIDPDRRAFFHRTGLFLYGTHYRAPLAQDLGVRISRVRDWGRGRSHIPEGVLAELKAMVELRSTQLQALTQLAERLPVLHK